MAEPGLDLITGHTLLLFVGIIIIINNVFFCFFSSSFLLRLRLRLPLPRRPRLFLSSFLLCRCQSLARDRLTAGPD